MNWNPRTRACWPLMLGLGVIAACRVGDSGQALDSDSAAKSAAEGTLTLVEGAATTPREAAVDLSYTRAADRSGARMAEIRVAYDPAALTYLRAEALDATTAAGKQLVVQDEGGRLRVLIYASGNLERLDSGGLARLVFTRTGGHRTEVALLEGSPIFAPPEADLGTTLGPPLWVGGD